MRYRVLAEILFVSFLAVLGATLVASPVAAQESAQPAAAALEQKQDSGPLPVAAVKHDGPVDFEKEILPVLRKKCIACHNKGESKSGLSLETPQTILEGGKHGPAVVAKQPPESLLFRAASWSAKPFMPPKQNRINAPPLTPEELGLVKLWIEEGATGTVNSGANPANWRPLPPAVNPIYAAAVTADARLAACGRANQVFIYNLAEGALVTRLTDPALAASGPYAGSEGVADIEGVQSLAFRPQGDLLASGGYRTVKLWKRPRGARKLELTEAGGDVTAVAASPDGARLAAGTSQGKVILWDLADGKRGRTLAAHTAAVMGLAFSPDGAHLVSGSQDGSIGIWSAVDGFPVARLGAPGPVSAVALTGKEPRIISGGPDGVLRIWSLPDGGPVATLSGHSKPVTALAAVPGDAAQVISGSEDGTLRLWDVANAKEVRQANHGAPIIAVAARPDGKSYASAGADKSVKLWKAEDAQLLAEVKGDPEARHIVAEKTREVGFLGAIAGAAKGQLAAADAKVAEATKKSGEAKAALDKLLADQTAEVAKSDQTAKSPADKEKAAKEAAAAKKKAEDALAEAEGASRSAAEEAARQKGSSEAAEAVHKRVQGELESATKSSAERELPVRAIAFSPDSEEIAAAGEDRTIRVWSAKTGAPLFELSGHGGAVLAVAFVPGKGIVSGSADDSAALWQERPRWPLERVIGSVDDPSALADRVTAVAFSPDGSLLATGGGEPSRSGELKVWKVEDGSLSQAIPNAHSDVILGVEFSPDGRLLASASADKFVKVFEVAGGKLVRAFEGHTNQVLDVSWKSDGKVLASAGADSVIKVWNLESGEQVRTIGGFGKQVTSIQFWSFTSFTFSSSGDKTVRLHNTDDGANPRNFGGATDYMYTVAATPDGKIVTAGGHASVLHVWKGDNAEVVKTFEAAGEKK